jgi:hypothetical protein
MRGQLKYYHSNIDVIRHSNKYLRIHHNDDELRLLALN